jgi:hypothetical protein
MMNSSTSLKGRKAVALIASSGGGAATLGHTDAPNLLQTIQDELSSIEGGGAYVRYALFASLTSGKGMDSAKEDLDQAFLYQVDPSLISTDGSQDLSYRIAVKGTLKQVNDYCRGQDEILAQAVTNGDIHGIICISCHTGIFRRTLQAAASANIPLTGSGGTSLSQIATKFGIRLVGNSGGSVATTSYTRAVSYTHALASHWGRTYQPWKNLGIDRQDPAWTSVLNACLPAFWAVCTAKYVLRNTYSVLESFDFAGITETRESIQFLFHGLEEWALPTACAVVMATSMSSSTGKNREKPTSSLIMAAVIASMGCSQSILGGLVAGWLVSYWSERLLFWCIFNNVPATMTNMMTAGGIGGIIALTTMPLATLLRFVTAGVRHSIMWSVTARSRSIRAASGFVWGCLSCYGSKVGWYHAYHLPLSLIEMELGEASFLGAIDELTLVLVCAGICAGTLLVRTLFSYDGITDADVAICRRGLIVNVCCGDFIEIAYPYMEKHAIINVGGYLASGLSSAWLVASAVSKEELPRSLAYLPLPVSIALAANEWERMAVACVIAAGVSMVATLLHYIVIEIPTSRRQKRD